MSTMNDDSKFDNVVELYRHYTIEWLDTHLRPIATQSIRARSVSEALDIADELGENSEYQNWAVFDQATH